MQGWPCPLLPGTSFIEGLACSGPLLQPGIPCKARSSPALPCDARTRNIGGISSSFPGSHFYVRTNLLQATASSRSIPGEGPPHQLLVHCGKSPHPGSFRYPGEGAVPSTWAWASVQRPRRRHPPIHTQGTPDGRSHRPPRRPLQHPREHSRTTYDSVYLSQGSFLYAAPGLLSACPTAQTQAPPCSAFSRPLLEATGLSGSAPSTHLL